jgi:DNA (cytosine-5)-methyltransferase 1
MVSDDEFTVLDVFSGAGGLSEGFFRAGFKFVSHIDKDQSALMTLETRSIYHALNNEGMNEIYINYIKGDISRRNFLYAGNSIAEQISESIINLEFTSTSRNKVLLEVDKCKRKANIKRVDVIIGGPPCQAYSIVGRSRDPQRMQNDNRNYLYLYYLDLLKLLSDASSIIQGLSNDLSRSSPSPRPAPLLILQALSL